MHFRFLVICISSLIGVVSLVVVERGGKGILQMDDIMSKPVRAEFRQDLATDSFRSGKLFFSSLSELDDSEVQISRFFK
jgi:hypothetical protein